MIDNANTSLRTLNKRYVFVLKTDVIDLMAPVSPVWEHTAVSDIQLYLHALISLPDVQCVCYQQGYVKAASELG